MNHIILKLKIWYIINILTKIWQFSDGIKLKIAKSQKELDEIFRLRWEVYEKLGYIDPKDFPDGKLKDKYDETSLNIMAYKNGRLTGTLRLVLPSPMGFPTENAFNLINFDFPKNQIGEISKLCIKENDSNCRKKIFLSLMVEVYKLSKKNGICYWLIGIPPSLKAHFEKLNFPVLFQQLKTGPLKPENIKERQTASKYFEKYQITPFLITFEF